jgi:hypothetical protein
LIAAKYHSQTRFLLSAAHAADHECAAAQLSSSNVAATCCVSAGHLQTPWLVTLYPDAERNTQAENASRHKPITQRLTQMLPSNDRNAQLQEAWQMCTQLMASLENSSHTIMTQQRVPRMQPAIKASMSPCTSAT